MKKVGIFDYGVGNLFSLQNAFQVLGVHSEIITSPQDISECSHLVLPGVGAFTPAIASIKEKGLDKILRDTKKSVLGICLGMQLLFEQSDEMDGGQRGTVEGLGLLPGKVKKFSSDSIVPHMGWNEARILKREGLAKSLQETTVLIYFAHSYYVETTTKDTILAVSSYDAKEFPVMVKYNNLYACQFHPEKSGKIGLKILEEFVSSLDPALTDSSA